jgi:hypothetical protein
MPVDRSGPATPNIMGHENGAENCLNLACSGMALSQGH